jgi:pimeloyl-ACP methyl ester carboxylesterase
MEIRTGWLSALSVKGVVTAGLMLVFFVTPSFAGADFNFDIEQSLSVDNAGTSYHGYEGDPAGFTPTIVTGDSIHTPSKSWTVHFLKPFHNAVPTAQGVYVFFKNSPDPTPEDGPETDFVLPGQNFEMVHAAVPTGAGPVTVSFPDLPALGTAEAQAGSYSLFVFELPETKFVYDPDTDTVNELPYTDADFVKWFEWAYGTNYDVFTGNTPFTYQPLAPYKQFDFNYTVATGTSLPSCCSSVMFLPGIEGSRLYRPDYNGGTDQLWEPTVDDHDNDVRDLFLAADGSSARSDVYAKEKDIINTAPPAVDIYQSFSSKMNGLKSAGTINDWEPISYDWRVSLDEILNNGDDINGRIYYSGDLAATSTPYVIQELKRLAAGSQTGKVTIVAHSNGGLLAKRLTEILGPEASALIDKIVLVASPQAGTPAAIASGMHGYDQSFFWVLSKSLARTFASTSPMFYNLLPSASYFTYVDDPVVTFDSTLPDWISHYGASIHSQASLDQFLTNSYGKVDSQNSNVNQPVQMHTNLLDSANTLHDNLDNWTPPSGVGLVQIAGWGVPRTVSGITYTKKGTGVAPDLNTTIDGDGTVVVPSALWTSTTAGATDYWVDLARYNRLTNRVLNGHLLAVSHGDILSISELGNFISDVVTNSTQPLSNYTYLSTTAPSGAEQRLRYSLHSPLTLNLYDDAGHHTGVSTTTGQVEEQIPGTYYAELGDVKYIFTDASTTAHIVMNGYDTGTFTLDVDQLQGDTQTGGATFTDVPTTPQTTAQVDMQSDITTLSTIRIDSNSDGHVDTYVAPDGGVLSIDQLLINLTTTVNGLTIKASLKTQLLNKIATIQKKIDKQKLKQSNVLAKLQAQVQKKADKGKIDATAAADIGTLLDGLISQSTTIPLDPTLITQLQGQINALPTSALKTSLLNKVAQLQNLTAITKSLAGFTQTIVKKGAKGAIPDADVQNILNVLDSINSAL